MDSEIITEDSIKADLMETIENAGATAEGALGLESGSNMKRSRKGDGACRAVYLVPCYNSKENTGRDVDNSVLIFRPMMKLPLK